jgi:hypothetical protein
MPLAVARANIANHDSRVMKSRQGYNVQAVLSEDQIKVGLE